MSPVELLRRGVDALGLTLPVGAQERLMDFLALLVKWNRTFNLTAIRGEADMVTQHLLDSLSLLPFLGGIASLADVGSGAGLPAIPLAIARPELRVVSFEPVQKKAAFQQQARIELGLDNLTVRCARVENEQGEFAVVTSRAFSSLSEFVRLAGHLAEPGGRLLAMKGVHPADEIAALPDGWQMAACHALRVPGLAAQRHLVILQKKEDRGR